MIKCCIFDLDGTLLNTLDTITYYVNLTLKRRGLAPLSVSECRSFIGDGARNLISRSLRSRGIDDREETEKALREYIDAYDGDNMYLTRPYDGVPELLTRLKAEGVKLAVLSNKQNSTVIDVIKTVFPDTFDIVRGGVDGVPLKPMPDGGIILLSELGIDSSEAAFIGDTGVDVRMGKNLGVSLTAAVSWGYRDRCELCGADVIVDDAEALFVAITEA